MRVSHGNSTEGVRTLTVVTLSLFAVGGLGVVPVVVTGLDRDTLDVQLQICELSDVVWEFLGVYTVHNGDRCTSGKAHV
jgi:hypothetical protein